MTGSLPDTDDYDWEFEKRGSVGIWDLRGWEGWKDEQLEAVSDHYRERASREDITATLAIFGDKTNLPAETQEYMSEEWTANVEYADVEKVGFVAEGITGMAVKSRMDVSVEVDDFDTLAEGIEWARS
jgi:hypothetical protein